LDQQFNTSLSVYDITACTRESKATEVHIMLAVYHCGRYSC